MYKSLWQWHKIKKKLPQGRNTCRRVWTYYRWTQRKAYFPHSFLMPFWFFLFSGETGDCWPESMPDDMGDTSDSVDSSVFSDFAGKTEGTHLKCWRFISIRKFQSLQYYLFPVLRCLMTGSQNNPQAKWLALEQERHQTVKCSGILHCSSQQSDVYPPAVKSSSFQRGAEACVRGWRETQWVIVLVLFSKVCLRYKFIMYCHALHF